MKTLGLGAALVATLAVSALLDQDAGWDIWRELRADLDASRARVEALSRGNEALRREIHALESEPTALDRLIREELDLALPGEVVVRFRAPGEHAGTTTGLRSGSTDRPRREGREGR